MSFTTRPELQGTFGVCASTHWIATAVGMRMLEAGGNAFDAGGAMGFALNVVEPHLNGPLGDMPALVWPAGAEAPQVICGQGTAPAGATLDHYRDEGLELIPGSGLLATVIPGAFDAWMVMLRDHGTMTLREVLEPAIYYAEEGHPVLASVSAMIAQNADLFRDHWPTSAETWLPGGEAPAPGAMFRNPELAAFWRRLLEEAETADGREAQIEAARTAFYEGFVAEAIDDAAEQALADGDVDDGAGALDLVAFLDLGARAEDHDADVVGFEVQGHALHAIGEFDHFTGLDIVEPVDAGDAVADGQHLADFRNFRLTAEIGDLFFQNGRDFRRLNIHYSIPFMAKRICWSFVRNELSTIRDPILTIRPPNRLSSTLASMATSEPMAFFNTSLMVSNCFFDNGFTETTSAVASPRCAANNA